VHRSLLLCLLPLLGCGGADALSFAAPGALTSASGRGSFRFGVATAATQIEDHNPNTDWYLWTRPIADGGLGHSTFVADAAGGYTRAIDDIDLLTELHVDSYRFSIEWARVMPTRRTIDEVALAHYRTLLEALVARGIRPMVTVHHFSNPVWIDDPRDPTCANGPSDQNLCGLGHPIGGPLVIAAMADFATLLGQRYGDLVDEWGTLNEPVNYLLASEGVGSFPPGKMKLFNLTTELVPVIRDFLAAHAAMYHALKAADVVDADGDGVAAAVGIPLSAIEWAAARDNLPSNDPADLAARDRVAWVYHYLLPESLRQGRFDADLDGTLDEDHPDWKGTLDWLGVQHYFRSGVTSTPPAVPALGLTPCYPPFDFGSCLKPLHPSFCVPQMHYEYNPSGLYPILKDFSQRWPDLPLLVTEGGIGTEVGERRSANIVRSLEQIERAREEGMDVRGYYHWSLYDNFEWAEGFAPHFGLYSVDRSTFTRTATSAVATYSTITSTRSISAAFRSEHGGDGPLPPEPGIPADPSTCSKDALGF